MEDKEKMNKKFNELKWKFFWEQKREEVSNFFEILLIIFLAVIVGLIGATLLIMCLEGFLWLAQQPNFLKYFVIGVMIVGLSILGFTLWINSNIKKAERRAAAFLRLHQPLTKMKGGYY